MLPSCKRLCVGEHSTSLSTWRPWTDSTCRWFKSDHSACFCRKAPSFLCPFCINGDKNPSSLKLVILLVSAKALPTLCVKASAQKASRAKVQKCIKIKGAQGDLDFKRPHGQKECKRFACPSNPPTMRRFRMQSFSSFEAPILNIYTTIVKSG
jgi:hypothetical protein